MTRIAAMAGGDPLPFAESWFLLFVQLPLAALLVAAMLYDLLSFRIPNALCGAIVLLFTAVALSLPGVPWLSHIGAALVVFGVGAVLFHFNLMGGGDVKLLAAVALWSGFHGLPLLLAVVALLGGVLALALLLMRWLVPGSGAGWPRVLQAGAPVPYGIAIGGGGLAVLSLLPLA